jgi:hypothetical protein
VQSVTQSCGVEHPDPGLNLAKSTHDSSWLGVALTPREAEMKLKGTTLAGITALLVSALPMLGCRDPVAPEHGVVMNAPSFAMDQFNGTLGANGTAILKGFNPTNPHRGAAIIATFFWGGSTNIITSVSDHLTDGTPVGNPYTLVEYVTAGGLSMATYVATNVQNFPDPNPDQDRVLVVQANLSSPITRGGVMISSYSDVAAVTAQALGAHSSATGTGSSPTIADPGVIAVEAGAMAYGVTLSDGVVGTDAPAGFTNISTLSDETMRADGQYATQLNAGTVHPQWTWYFNAPSAWLATVLTLKSAATQLAVLVQPSTTLPLGTIKPAVQVRALDAQGNPATSFTGPVTIAIGRNGGLLVPGTLSGTRTVLAVNGVATFADLSIDQPGNGYTLTVTANGLTGAQSAPFNIGAF